MREVKDRTLTVAWTPGFNGGRLITRYIIEIKEKQREQSSTVVAAQVETAGS